jgi:hypothetical protein
MKKTLHKQVKSARKVEFKKKEEHDEDEEEHHNLLLKNVRENKTTPVKERL